MINQDTMYNVKNRSSSVVVYRIPENNIRREFAPGETKKIAFGELEKLTYQAGGRELLEKFLQIVSNLSLSTNFPCVLILLIPELHRYHSCQKEPLHLPA